MCALCCCIEERTWLVTWPWPATATGPQWLHASRSCSVHHSNRCRWSSHHMFFTASPAVPTACPIRSSCWPAARCLCPAHTAACAPWQEVMCTQLGVSYLCPTYMTQTSCTLPTWPCVHPTRRSCALAMRCLPKIIGGRRMRVGYQARHMACCRVWLRCRLTP